MSLLGVDWTSAGRVVWRCRRPKRRKGDYAQAVLLYVRAMEMRPNDDEARAALYNMGCALAKQKQWDKATDCIMQAVNNYSLKLSVALKVWQADAASNCACATRPAPTKH